MARAREVGEVVFQWYTPAWRRKALKLLALRNDTTMNQEIELAVDDRLREAGIPLGDGK